MSHPEAGAARRGTVQWKFQIPKPKSQASLKISKLQRMPSATLGIETLGFPWDLVLGVWDFHCEVPRRLRDLMDDSAFFLGAFSNAR